MLWVDEDSVHLRSPQKQESKGLTSGMGRGAG